MKCQCEFCKKVFNVEDKYAGKNVGCPNCGKQITIQEYIELKNTENINSPKAKNTKKTPINIKYLLITVGGIIGIVLLCACGVIPHPIMGGIGIVAICHTWGKKI